MADFVFPEDGGTGATDGDFNDAANFGSLAQATGLKDYVVQGLNFTLNAGTPSLDISEGKAVVTANSVTANQSGETRDGIAFVADMDARTGIGLTDGDVNHVFLQVDLSTDDTINIIVNTTNSAPAQPYVKLGTVDTTNDTTTELNRDIPISLGELESLDAGSRIISNLPAPTNPNDAARKQYVDAIEQGLNLKDAVRAATESNVDLASATDPNPVDGVTLSDGDRVLLKSQTTASENGIYVATTATDPTTWTRSADFDEDVEVTSGSFTFVEEGTLNANRGFVVTTNDPITVGTTDINWTQFSGAGQINAGEGLTKTGDTLDVRLDIDDDGGNVTPAYGINFGGNYFDVADDGDNTVSVSFTNDSVTVNGGDGLKNGGSVALGGSLTLDVEPADFAGTGLQDDGADNLQLINTAVTVAGNTVSLGNSTAVAVSDLSDVSNISGLEENTLGNKPVAGTEGRIFFESDTGKVLYDNGSSWVDIGVSNHSQLSGINSDDHHTRYSDEESQDSVGTILGSAFNYDDATPEITFVAGNVDVTNFDGSSGTSGQVLQTDGTSLSFGSVAGGMTDSERQVFNDLMAAVARNQFEHNLTELAYDGGIFDIFRDESKIASKTDVLIETLDGGDSNGTVEIAPDEEPGINNISYDNQSFGPGQSISGIFMKPDGTKLYLVDRDAQNIDEYDLSTAYDISTASLVNTLDTSSNAANAFGMYIGNSGETLLLNDNDANNLVEYSLSTAWDLSTATHQNNADISGNVGTPIGLTAKPDGSKVFIMDFSADTVQEYTLSTAWDTTTLTNNASFDVSSETTADNANALWILQDNGDKMVVNESGGGTDTLYQYTLSTPWDITSASFDGVSRDISSEGGGTTRDVDFVDRLGESKMYKGDDGDTNSAFRYSAVEGSGFSAPGTIISETKDLSLQENGGFSAPPSSVVISQKATIPAEEDIQYVVRDNNGNTVTVTQADIDTEVDTSNFTSTVVEIETQLLSSDSADTPTLDDYMAHFKE